IAMSVPDEDAREQILRVLCEKLLLSGDFDIRELAKRTPGYVGADLTALTTAAGMIAVKRIFHKLQEMTDVETKESNVLATEDAEKNKSLVDDEQMMAVDRDEVAIPVSTPVLWDAQPATDRLRTISGFLARHPDPLTPEELAPLAITNDDFVLALQKKTPLAADVDLATIAADSRCEGLSGADLAGLIREASVAALRTVFYSEELSDENASSLNVDNNSSDINVTNEHFQAALERISPSVSAADMRRYESLRKLYGK
ncbi:Ribosome biogenesis ATPase rix7, partial [Coemansia sp. RSA 2703]